MTLKKYVKTTLATTTILTGIFAFAEQKAEVIHWWTSEGESKAVGVFADAFEAKGGVWEDNAVAGGSNARSAGINRIVGGTPPAALLFNTSTQFKELAEEGMLRDVAPIVKNSGAYDAIPKIIKDAVEVEGKMYALPVNIHANTWLFYNKAVFDAVGITEFPNNWDDLFALADKIKEAGYTPFALGGQSWQERLTFEHVLLTTAGADIYKRIFVDKDISAFDEASVVKAIGNYLKIKDYIDSGSPGRSWNDSANMVISQKAAMQIMGDWMKGEFKSANMTAGQDYGCIVGPSEFDDIYMLAGDVFVFPEAQGDTVDAQNLLIDVMVDSDVQIEFNKTKGSVPIRTDLDVSSMDICAQDGAARIAKGTGLVPYSGLTVDPDDFGEFQDMITQLWNDDKTTVESFTKEIKKLVKNFR